MKKAILYGLALTALFVLLIGSAFGAVLRKPLTTNVMRGTYVVNVTTTFQEAQNCTVTFSSSSTGDSASVIVYNQTGTGADKMLNASFDTTVLEDGIDYSATGTCYNGTKTTPETETITTVASIYVDNTKPTAPSSLSPTTADNENINSWSATVTDSETVACQLYVIDPIKTQQKTMTYSTTSCTYSGDIVVDGKSGTVTWYVEASDGYNFTNSSAATITFEKHQIFPPAGSTTSTTAKGKLSKEKILVIVIGLVALYAAGIFDGKKKRR